MVKIFNPAGFPVEKEPLKKLAKKVLKEENVIRKDLHIVLVSPERIKDLNRRYRSKDEYTDVLSFPDKDFPEPGSEDKLGEVVICPDKAKDLSRVLVHAILHLTGYDHERSPKEAKFMEEKTKYYLQQ